LKRVRAKILERSRRGKRHRARAGEISVLSGAPYGYRYIRKRDEAPAAYAMIETEARVVQQVYESYTAAGWSIGAITRWLNERGVATRKPGTRWERSMGATPTGDAGAAGARRHDHSEQRPP
jgi:site-specific DNA recombinase